MGDPGKKKRIARPAAVSPLRYALALVSVGATLDSAHIFLSLPLPQRFTPCRVSFHLTLPTKVEALE
jgi:hypothetical protein